VLIVVVAGGADTTGPVREERASPQSVYLDMSTPLASLRSYAAAVRAHRWTEACRHFAEVASGNELGGCLMQVGRIGQDAGRLRVRFVGLTLRGEVAYVRFRSNLGFERGLATLARHDGRWLIRYFRPEP
jgi:hypothetical protein